MDTSKIEEAEAGDQIEADSLEKQEPERNEERVAKNLNSEGFQKFNL